MRVTAQPPKKFKGGGKTQPLYLLRRRGQFRPAGVEGQSRQRAVVGRNHVRRPLGSTKWRERFSNGNRGKTVFFFFSHFHRAIRSHSAGGVTKTAVNERQSYCGKKKNNNNTQADAFTPMAAFPPALVKTFRRTKQHEVARGHPAVLIP